LQRERQFILANHDLTTPLVWNSADLIIRYLPAGFDTSTLPVLFQGIPVSHSAEVESAGQTWMLLATPTPTGQLYLAKNISHFEARETVFERLIALVALAILALSVVTALWSSRKLTRPLQHLAHTIAHTPAGSSMPPITLPEPCDAELHAIAASFNRFIEAQQAYVQRERALLRMAGHELRTPIAVLAGALDVLQARADADIHEKNHATLTRAQRACDEMRDNVNTLLTLARASVDTPPTQAAEINLDALVQQIAADLHHSHPDAQRLVLNLRAPHRVTADPALARMLLRNLMQNALQHTRGTVAVRVTADAITITDQGAGLPAAVQALLRGQLNTNASGAPTGGLGLYIVTLIAERLGWRLDMTAQADGASIQIRTRGC